MTESCTAKAIRINLASKIDQMPMRSINVMLDGKPASEEAICLNCTRESCAGTCPLFQNHKRNKRKGGEANA